MSRVLGVILVAFIAISAPSCKKKGGGPTTPTQNVTGISITMPAGRTLFLQNSIQFDARESLSDGTSRTPSSANWSSDNNSVATVSSTGLVTGVSAGQATIAAETTARGTLLVRVFPSFGGSWTGQEVVLQCDDSGDFEGLCADPDIDVDAGSVYRHDSTMTQDQATVTIVNDGGGGLTARATGSIALAGELTFPTTEFLPSDPPLILEMRNWRSRSDTSGRMTGSYVLYFRGSGLTGDLAVTLELRDVIRLSGGPTSTTGRRPSAIEQVKTKLIPAIQRRR
jgi:hypothetical protein